MWDEQFRIQRWSDRTEAIFGWSAAEVMGKTMLDWQFIFEPDLDRVALEADRLLKGGSSGICANRNYCKDGRLIDCEWFNATLLDESGNIISILSLVQDVSDRKKLELALQESEARYRLLSEVSPAGIFRNNLQGQCTYANPKTLEITGLTLAENLGEGWGKHLHPDDRDRMYAAWSDFVEQSQLNQDVKYQIEHRYLHADGALKWAYVEAVPEYNAAGEIAGFVGLVIDITERKIAELALQASEERFREIAQTISQFFFVRSATTGEFIYASSAYETIWGRSCESLYQHPQSWLEAVHPDDYAAVTQSIAEQFAGHSVEREYRIVRSDGEIRWISAQITLVKDDSGNPLRFIGTAADVSDRKTAELALQKSEARLRESQHIAKLGGWKLDLQSGEEYWSEEVFAIHELGVEDEHPLCFEDPSFYINFYAPEARPIIQAAFQNAIQAGEAYDLELPFVTAQGNHRWVKTMGQPVLADGVVTQLHGTFMDITDRKCAELALQESEARRRLALDLTATGSWEFEVATGEAIWSDSHYKLMGLVPGELPSNYQTWRDRIHPEDQEWVEQAFRQALETHSLLDVEYRTVYPNGTVRWVLNKGQGIYDQTGQAVRMLGVMLDISDRKHAEITLARELLRSKTLFETSIDGIVVLDQACQVLEANASFARMLGYSVAEVTTLNLRDFQAHWAPEELEQKIETGDLCLNTFETRHRRKDGSIYPVEISTNEVDWYGQVVHFGICRDISDRKRIEAERKQAAVTLQSLVEGTASVTGEDFFTVLAQQIAVALEVSHVLVTRLVGEQLQSLGFYADQQFQTKTAYLPIHTPCERVMQAGQYYCSSGIQAEFPLDVELQLFGSESYLGIALKNAQGDEIGVLCIFNRNPIANPQRAEALLKIFGARAAAEIERLQTLETIQQLNTELEQRVQQRTQELAKLAAIVENSTDLIGLATLTGESLYLNPAGQQLMGLSDPATLPGMPVAAFLSPEGVSQFEQQALPALHEQGYWRGESIFRHLQTGEDIIAEQTLFLVKDSQTGTPMCLATICRDIRARKQLESDRQQAEMALRESERRYASLAAAAPVAIFRFDQPLNCVFVNNHWSEMTGRPIESALGRGWLEALHSEDRDHLLAQYTEGYAQLPIGSRIIDLGEGRHLRPDGSINWFYVQVVPEIDAEGEVVGYVGTLTDLTERKRIEDELAQSEAKFRSLVEGTNDLIWSIENDGRFSYLSPQFKTLFGWEPSEWLGQPFMNLVHPDDLELVAIAHQENVTFGVPKNTEFRHRHRDGHYVWVSVSATPVKNAEGLLIKVQGTLADISDRKQAEQENRRLKERLEFLLGSSPAMIYSCAPRGDYGTTFISKNVQTILGYKPEDFVAVPGFWKDRIHPDDVSRVFAELSTLLEHGIHKYEYRFRHQEGYYVWLTDEQLLVKDEHGNPSEIVGYWADISDRKQGELVSQRYARMVSAAPDGIALIDHNYIYSLVNQAYLDRNHKQWDEIVGHSVSDLFGEETFQTIIKPKLDRCLAGETLDYEAWFNFMALGSRFMRVTYAPYCELDSIISGVIVTSRDETDRQQAEFALRDSEERLRLALNASNQGLYDLNVQTGETIVSPEYATMLGYDPATFKETNTRWIERLHPDDLEQVAAAYRDYIAGKIPEYKIEFRQRTQAGQWKWILSLGKILTWDQSGHPLRMLGTHTDIDEIKRTEQALKASNITLESVINSTPDVIFVKDMQGRTVIVNDAFAQFFAKPKAELLGKDDADLWPADIVDHIRNIDQRIMTTGIAETFEEAVYTEDIDAKTYLTSKFPWRDPQGNVIGLIGMARDISDRKQAEAQIQASLQQKELLLREMHHRIKNNLQVVSSLLMLQSETLTDRSLRQLLQESQDRVTAIALVHESLYQTENLERVDLAQYIQNLLAHIFDTYRGQTRGIELRLSLEPIDLNLETILPCCLILNELVVNAFKHGFNDGRRGFIFVGLSHVSDQIILQVKNNGMALPVDFEINQVSSLGLQLVRDLIGQLEGTLKLDPALSEQGGVEFEITFKELIYRRRI